MPFRSTGHLFDAKPNRKDAQAVLCAHVCINQQFTVRLQPGTLNLSQGLAGRDRSRPLTQMDE